MTHLPLPFLERLRAEGKAPKGGVAGDFSEIKHSLELSPHERLDALLNLQWDHPLDSAVMTSIREIAGNHSRATILTAAECVRERNNGSQPREIAVNAYSALVANLER